MPGLPGLRHQKGALLPLLGIVDHFTHVVWRWTDGAMPGEPSSRSEEISAPAPS